MKITVCVAYGALALLSGTAGLAEPGSTALSVTAAAMDRTDGLELKGEPVLVAEGPGGTTVMRFDNPFSGRIDLKELGIDPQAFDLVKVEVKADRAANFRISLENYPREGELSHWYALDSMRGTFGWRTLWIDLKRPEEVKTAGTYKGMEATNTSLRGLQFMGSVSDTRRQAQGPGRSLWLGKIRFVKKAVELTWDQRQAPYEWGTDKALVFRYPLIVTNRLDRPIAVKLSLVPFQVKQASGTLSQTRVELDPLAQKTVEAQIVLPAAAAAAAEPLYTELFEVRAEAEGIPDSEVTLLSSSDPIHLAVTVPIPEDKLQFPLLPSRKSLPADVTEFDEALARRTVEAQPAETLAARALEKNLDVSFTAALSSAAFLHEFTGEAKFLDYARTLLAVLPDVWSKFYAEWEKESIRRSSAGIVSANTLSLGWLVGGTQRSPYLYGRGGNEKAGNMSGIAPCFDMLAPKLDPAFRRRLVETFFLPVAIQARNHYFGPGNQQCTANVATLYGGLVARNWPLVAFAHTSEHGWLRNLDWAFDDDGLSLEGHYQTYTARPMLWSAELLLGRGINLYNERFFHILHSAGAIATGVAFKDSFLAFADQARFPGSVTREKQTDGFHLTGSTLLRWNGLETVMNWGTHIYRGAPDRCSLIVRMPAAKENDPLRALGGTAYSHSSFDQSILILDEGVQDPVAAEVLGYDVEGPVQYVTARSEKHYPGSVITRTYALIDAMVLVLDRVRNDKPRTADWRLNGAGATLSVPTEQKTGSWTAKPDDKSKGATFGASVKQYAYAKTADSWQEGGGRLVMAGEPGTELIAWPAGEKSRICNLMVRRAGVAKTDFAALISSSGATLERKPVLKADGKPADAVGVAITLKDGRVILALANDEPVGTEVALGSLKTSGRFATDFETTAK